MEKMKTEEWEEGFWGRFTYEDKLYEIEPPLASIFEYDGKEWFFTILKYNIGGRGTSRNDAIAGGVRAIMFNKEKIEEKIIEVKEFNSKDDKASAIISTPVVTSSPTITTKPDATSTPSFSPTIKSISPSSITYPGGTFELTIYGSNFDRGAVDEFYRPNGDYLGSGVLSKNLIDLTSTKIVVKEYLSPDVIPGNYTVKVKNSDGTYSNGVIFAVLASTISSLSEKSPDGKFKLPLNERNDNLSASEKTKSEDVIRFDSGIKFDSNTTSEELDLFDTEFDSNQEKSEEKRVNISEVDNKDSEKKDNETSVIKEKDDTDLSSQGDKEEILDNVNQSVENDSEKKDNETSVIKEKDDTDLSSQKDKKEILDGVNQSVGNDKSKKVGFTGDSHITVNIAPSMEKKLKEGLSTYINRDRWTINDTLGYDIYANAINLFLKHPDTKPPLTISIESPWGGGKTSLMRMVQKLLDPMTSEIKKYKKYSSKLTVKKFQSEYRLLIDKKSQITEKTLEKLPHNIGNEKLKPLLNKEFTEQSLINKLKDLGYPKEQVNEIMTYASKEAKKPELSDNELQGMQRLTIWFNVWKYENTNQIWSGLADAIVRQVSERMEPVEREKFLLYLTYNRLDFDKVRYKIHESIFQRIYTWLLVLGSIFVFSIIFFFFFSYFSYPNWTSISSFVFSILSCGTFIARYLLETLRITPNEPAKINLSEYLRVPDYSGSLGFIHYVEEDLRKVFDVIPEEYKPLVIFIDDLDRCSPQKVADVIEGINLFLGGEFEDCIFILAMDHDIVAAALEEAHSKVIAKLRENANKNIPIGRKFMEKFVQLPFTLPEPEVTDLEHYTMSLLSGSKKGNPASKSLKVVKELPVNTVSDTHTESHQSFLQQNLRKEPQDILKKFSDNFSDQEGTIRELILKIAPEFSKNPRELKRFLNRFRFVYFIKTVIVEYKYKPVFPSALARWVVLSLKWPELASQIYNYYIGKGTDAKKINPLKEFEDIAKKSGSLTEWETNLSVSNKIQVLGLINFESSTSGETGEQKNHKISVVEWLRDESLMKFFKNEDNLQEWEKISSIPDEDGWLP